VANVNAAGTAGANKQMVFDQIEKLKQQFTDKYVVVDASRPELARFQGSTGRVKTVNMSGRALVEFDANNNIGWYDIDLDYLKVVDQPLPKPVESHEKPAKKEAPAAAKPKAAAAPAGEKKLSPLEMARAQGAVKKGGEAPKKSTADILAAARGPKVEGGAPAAEKKKPSTADILAAARAKQAPAEAKAAAPAPAKPAAEAPKASAAAPKGKLSTAEILAAARANKGEASAVKPATPPAAAPIEEPAITAVEETFAAEPEPVAAVEKPAAAKSTGGKPTTTADKIAWCREHDSK
jgi:hypothetical protein